jgi:serine/threonine protein kinase
MSGTPEPLDDDPRIMEAARSYLEELEAGRRPDRNLYLKRNPDLAAQLAECLDGIDLAHRAGAAFKNEHASNERRPDLPSDPLGDFKIVREIGRGGMGVVYEAIQMSLGRRVALKVLPFAATFDSKHLQRFHNEAHAAGQLHHTNIVPVYNVGCERGVHYYAMQLIDGHSLATIIQQLRNQQYRNQTAPPASSAPTQKLVPDFARSQRQAKETVGPVALTLSTLRSGRGDEFHRTAAQYAIQAAEALEHAHQFGIVHRDIKPGNLLGEDRGRLWVTDFGLAQFHSDAGLTQTGDMMGTLRYMSPEQASGKRLAVDHRTDIYSLGATLYELVTLEPIFPGLSREEILHQILNREPAPPRTIAKNVPVDLETIILKAVSKSPADRYASAADLAADLRRFLEFKPIAAKRPSLFDRGKKWLRRHPAVAWTALTVLAFGAIGFGISTALIARERGKERKRAHEAEARFLLARQAADDMIQIADEELSDNPFMEGAYKRMLESALGHYQRFIEERSSDPDAQAELAATRDRVKRLVADLAMLQGDRNLPLLREPGVLADLRVNDEQRQKLTDWMKSQFERRDDPFREFHRLTADERRQRFLEVARSNEAAVAGILDKSQLNRLRQIARQMLGPRALTETDVATTLKLSAEKRQRVRSIEAEMFFGGPEALRPGEFRPTPEEIRQDAMQKIEALLSDDQRRQWQAMIGEPYRGPIPVFFRGPPRQFGPPPFRPPPR